MIKKFISYYKPHGKLFFFDMFCALMVALCDLFYPVIAKNIINEYVPQGQLRMLVIWGVILLGIFMTKAVLNYFISYYGHVMGVRMQADMRRDMFRHLQKLPFSYFDDNKTGGILSRMLNDLFDVSELAHHGPEDLFLSIILFAGSFIMLSGINIELTIIIFSLIPFIVFFAVKMRKRMSEAFRRTREQIAEVNANVETAISGIRVSRAYTAETYENKKFDDENNLFKALRSMAYKVMGQFHSGMTFFTDILYLIVLIAGGLFFYFEKINIGEYTMYLLYINLFLDPIKRFISFFEQLQNGMTGFKRFDEIIEVEAEKDSPDAVDVNVFEGNVEFKNVSFKYKSSDAKDKEAMILKNFSLNIEKGKTVALVGTSGGGKTTICNLIPRFYEIDEGSILIDGIDVRAVRLEPLRKNIGIVAQDVFIFNGTIRENIAYGNLDATDDEIISAAKKANIHDYIMTLEAGYQTNVGERGIKLSGGQKQRISIARVFLKNPLILILDEATSALDNATEMQIQSSLEELTRGRTAIVVAHRLSTVKNADEIVVVTEDGIKEQGTHEELMKANGLYKELYSYQFRV